MRSFYLRAYDDELNIIAEYALENVTDPSGLGLKMKYTKVDGDVKDYVINSAIDKQLIKLKVHFIGRNLYEQYRYLRNWIGSYANRKNTLVFDDGEGRTYGDKSVMEMEIKVQELGLGVIEAGVLTADLAVQALTPQYTTERKIQSIETTTVVKKYSYSYPYSYGGGGIPESQRTIQNTFYRDIPLSVKLYGPIVNPQVTLADEDGNIYSMVRFNSLTLAEGATIEINAMDMTVRYTSPAGATIDYYNAMDHTQDTFLYAKSGKSSIRVNLDQNKKAAKAEITYTQYMM